MSRSLRPVLFVLFLAAAVSASAGPEDVFDARAPGALLPGQRETILALDNGRYTLRDGYFVDARPADPARAKLTNAKVAELLAAAQGAANGRGEFAAQTGEAAKQRVIARMPKAAPAQLNFDGGVARGGGIRGPPAASAAAAPSGATPNPAVLQAQLLTRLVFKGTGPEREAMSEAIATILKSKTGRELAAQFVAERATAEVKMSSIANSTTLTTAGMKTLSGTSGMTDTENDPPVVTLNRAYLDTDPDYRRMALAGTLAHELFGHAFEEQRAKKAGVPHMAHYFYRGDEGGSRLIDWLIQTELAGKTVDGDSEAYLADIEGYYRALAMIHPYYATTLSRAEMKNPADTLKGRLRLVSAATVAHYAGRRDMEAWKPIIEHFAKAHGVSRARLKPAEEQLSNYFASAKVTEANLAEIKTQLESRIAYWQTVDGVREKNSLIASADSPYMVRMDASLAARARELRRLRAVPAGGGGAAAGPVIEMDPVVITVTPQGATLDLAALGDMYRDDLKRNPGHWNK